MPQYRVIKRRRANPDLKAPIKYKYEFPRDYTNCDRCNCACVTATFDFHLCDDLTAKNCANGYTSWLICRKHGDTPCGFHDLDHAEKREKIQEIMASAPDNPKIKHKDPWYPFSPPVPKEDDEEEETDDDEETDPEYHFYQKERYFAPKNEYDQQQLRPDSVGTVSGGQFPHNERHDPANVRVDAHSKN